MKKVAILSVFIFSVLLSACSFPTGEQKEPSSSLKLNNPKSTTPKFVNIKLDKNLSVKADIIGANAKNLKTNTIFLKNFDEEQTKKVFLKNKKVVKTNEVVNWLFPEYKDKFFDFSDGSYLTKQYGSLVYSTPYFEDREYDNVLSGTTYFIRSDLKEVFNKTTLENIDKNIAIETVKNAANGVGISNLGKPEVVALDLKTLESEWEDYETKNGVPPRKWEKADEAYAVIFPVVYDNINITNKGYANPANQMNATGSRIMGVVTKGGLIYFTASGIYEVGKILKEKITPITLETALAKVKNKYKNVLLTDPVRVSKIALEYVPTVSNDKALNYKLVPAWVFSAKQETTVNDKKGDTFKTSAEFTILINAETGQEIRSGGER